MAFMASSKIGLCLKTATALTLWPKVTISCKLRVVALVRLKIACCKAIAMAETGQPPLPEAAAGRHKTKKWNEVAAAI